MSIRPEDLISLATSLTAGTTEVEHRASVSRSYYAAYQFALAWEARLPCRGSESGAHGVHLQLINRLRYPGPLCSKQQQAASKKLSFQLDRLKNHRVFADYRADGALRQVTASQVLADAASVLKTT